MTLEQFFPWIERLGIGAVFAWMWWLERKERIRLQGIIESYLPVITSATRVQRSLRKAITGEDGEGE